MRSEGGIFRVFTRVPLSCAWSLQHPQQSVLYTILNALQGEEAQAAFIGLTCRHVQPTYSPLPPRYPSFLTPFLPSFITMTLQCPLCVGV